MDCSTIVDNADGSRAVLTKRALDRADNNFQAIIDCIPEGTSLMLDLPSVHPNHTIVLERPIRIGSISGSKTEFKCPPGGLLDIRYVARVQELSDKTLCLGDRKQFHCLSVCAIHKNFGKSYSVQVQVEDLLKKDDGMLFVE